MKGILKKFAVIGLAFALSISALSVIPSDVSQMAQVQAASLKLNYKELYLRPDYYRELKLGKISPKKCKWKSSNKNVVSVADNGEIYTEKTGKAVIFCIYKNKTYKCKVTVVDDLKLSDFEYDTTAKDYTSDYHSKNAIEDAAIIVDMYDPYSHISEDYGDLISYNMRGVSSGASNKEIEKKFGEYDEYFDANENPDMYNMFTSVRFKNYASQFDDISYLWSYNNKLNCGGYPFKVYKTFYIDSNDKVLGSVCFIVFDGNGVKYPLTQLDY